MHSVGQTSAHFSQPVQASAKTLWIMLLAPMMASVGQRLKHLQQPMHRASLMKARVGPLPSTPARSTLTPSSPASSSARARPPGGQMVGLAAPQAMASAAGVQPG